MERFRLLLVLPSCATAFLVLLLCCIPLFPALVVSSFEHPRLRIYLDRPNLVHAMNQHLFFAGKPPSFIVSYTHSVNKGRVHDYCRIGDDGLVHVDKSRFVSYGAGMSEPEEGMVFTTGEGYLEISGINLVVPQVMLRVSLTGEHAIEANGRIWRLADYFPRQSAVVIEKRAVPLLYCIYP